MPIDVLFVRHATAAGTPPGGGDADRPLSPHGEEQAKQLGALLRGLIGGLELTLLCSPARRTRQTAELLGLGEPTLEPSLGLEEQGNERLIDLIMGTAQLLVLVSHQPNLLSAAYELVAESDRRKLQLPTTGVIGLERPDGEASSWGLLLLGSSAGLSPQGET